MTQSLNLISFICICYNLQDMKKEAYHKLWAGLCIEEMRTVLYYASKSISVCRACLTELLSSDKLEVAAPVKANSSDRHPEIQNTDVDWKPKLTVLVMAFWTYVFKVCSCVVIGRYLDVHLLQVQDKDTRNMVTRLLSVFLASSFKMHKLSL